MSKERILIRTTFKSPSIMSYESQTTSISFIPVCDNCNYVFNRVVGRVGDISLEPFMCPHCKKIIDCAILPCVDATGRLEYEED